VETITSEIGKGSQDVLFTRVVRLTDGTKLRVKIRSDSYDFQSYARVHRWDGTEWKLVHSVHYSKMATPAGLYVRFNRVADSTFKKDLDELLRVASAVLEVA